mgnify:CR=1 FL=1
MKISGILFIVVILVTTAGCKESENKKTQKAADLITIRTLGLAYLEEFKLEEAEKEFLKFIKLAPDQKLGYANLGLTYLRMGKYKEAEKQLLKAINIDPADPDTRLILATVYQMNNDQENAILQLQESLKHSPDHIKTLYALAEIFSSRTDETSQKLRQDYLLKLVEKAPANLVVHLELTDIQIRKGEYDDALRQMEIIKKQFPEFHKDANEYYQKTISALRDQNKTDLLNSFIIFHNYLKVTTPYQAGINELKGPGGSLIGFPVITFDDKTLSQITEYKSMLDALNFTDVTSLAGLDITGRFDPAENIQLRFSTVIASSDYDGDGDIDIFVNSWDKNSSSFKAFLFNDKMGRFEDVAAKTGLKENEKITSAIFADYNNDGFLDLFMTSETSGRLYRNSGNGTFDDVTSSAFRRSLKGGNISLFADFDHDGDLDIFIAAMNTNLLYRNNADGTFEEQSEKMGLAGEKINSTDAAFLDFDEDGDLDLFVANETGKNYLHSNQREGLFKDVASQSGVLTDNGTSAVAAGDYDNDGFLDLFIASSDGNASSLFHNLRNGTFEKIELPDELSATLRNVRIYDVAFVDLDNDGFIDLLAAGEPKEKDGKGIMLFHNDGKASFEDATSILPDNIKSARQIAVFDYNDDGDMDIALAALDGGTYLLRNNGGNIGHYIKMKLVGLRAGSAKNNYFGIGAKVELRAGELYQSKIVTDPYIHFGIGSRTKADVIRIVWTNGVPQNMFFPGANQDLVEAQMLKGSCPFLYAWNGNEYIFVKDILWRSALGMPMGIMGGTRTYGFADASDDYIKIDGELLKEKNGAFSVQLTDELWETIYLDKLELLAVDHPDSVEVFVDEKFTPPPFPELRIYKFSQKILPVSATDAEGNNQLDYILSKDDNYISDLRPEKYQGITEMRDLILDFREFQKTGNLCLFLQGWIFPTDASINFALSQSDALKVVPPVLQAQNMKGEWITIIDNLGFPMGKDKTVIADLSGKLRPGKLKLRIRTNMEIYWDHIFIADCKKDVPVVTNILDPVYADLHYRGFSQSFRKGGRYGPHWFEYSKTDTGPRWRDLVGNYTRYGDVLPLITEPDNKYVIFNAGDETTVKFSSSRLPDLKSGWKRDFLIRSVGWVKDGDMNTATGNSVLPLPYHGMKSYPPSEEDKYPDQKELIQYMQEYNTRVVTTQPFINAIKKPD